MCEVLLSETCAIGRPIAEPLPTRSIISGRQYFPAFCALFAFVEPTPPDAADVIPAPSRAEQHVEHAA